MLVLWMVGYQIIFLLFHVIVTAFYCNLFYDSFFWWESEEVSYLYYLSLNTLYEVLILGATALLAYLLYRFALSKKEHGKYVAIAFICAVFLLGAILKECLTYTIPELQNVKKGYSVLLPIDAVYIVFKYVFYIAISCIGYLFGIKADRHFTKKLS